MLCQAAGISEEQLKDPETYGVCCGVLMVRLKFVMDFVSAAGGVEALSQAPSTPAAPAISTPSAPASARAPPPAPPPSRGPPGPPAGGRQPPPPPPPSGGYQCLHQAVFRLHLQRPSPRHPRRPRSRGAVERRLRRPQAWVHRPRRLR